MLDAAQNMAVHHVMGPCLVVASPGSGKTTVIIERIRYLIREKGVIPNKILVITFTRDSAYQMKRRFEQVEKGSFSPVFGTFHSVFFHILTIEQGLGASNILYGEKKNLLLKKAIILNGIKTEFFDEFYNEIDNKLMQVKLASLKGEEITDDLIFKVNKTYESLKKEMNYLDFGDMIYRALILFKTNPEVLKRWKEAFSYILIDEAQDMNDLQFELIRMLSDDGNKIFAVGDEDQSIYGFRGSNPKIFVDFKEIYPDSTVLKLEKNYRSTKGIVSAASNLISHNKMRFEKNMVSFSERDSKIQVSGFENAYEEAMAVVLSIEDKINNGMDLKEIAILYRNNSVSNIILGILRQREIPFDIRRMVTKNESFIYEDFLSFIEMRNGILRREQVFKILDFSGKEYYRNFFRSEIVNWDEIFCSFRLIPEEKAYLLKLKQDLSMLKKLDPYPFVKFIRRSFRYDDGFVKKGRMAMKEGEEVLSSLEEIAKHVSSFTEFKAAILEITKTDNKNNEGVVLRTFHGAKGLEFKCVYVISACDGITPSNKAKTSGEIEEERRMFYVAITRAKKELYLSYSKKIGEKNYRKSGFIDELGLCGIVSGE